MVLIETYWNVNAFEGAKVISIENVLIETYWNVNDLTPPLLSPPSFVLIETYWNVNFKKGERKCSAKMS